MRQRKAFTLVEMLVAVALVIFIMVILSEAFVAGLETFRQLKGIGDMEERLRMVTTVLRQDLTSDHFEGRRRLSDPDFWRTGPPSQGFFRIWQTSPLVLEGTDADRIYSTRSVNTTLSYTIKKRGNHREDFFTARRFPTGSLIGFRPGDAGYTDGELNVLDAFTIFLQPDFPASRFQDAETYTSQWAEVAVFLRPNGTSAGGQPLFSLYRHVKMVLPNNSVANFGPAPAGLTVPPLNVGGYAAVQRYLTANRVPSPNGPFYSAPYAEFSCKKIGTAGYSAQNSYSAGNNTLYFNNPTDLTVPQRRYGLDQVSPAGFPIRLGFTPGGDASYPVFGDRVDLMPPNAAPTTPLLGQDPTLQGADLLLADVLSFDVQILIPESMNRLGVPALGDPLRPLDPFVDLHDSIARAQYPWVPGQPPSVLGQVPLPVLFPNTADPVNSPDIANPMFEPGGPLASNPNLGGNLPRVFDTWSNQPPDGQYDYSYWNDQRRLSTLTATELSSGIQFQRVPLRLRILALKITLRVWDAKTQQVRQITMIQDM